jgi:hypothetical protein
MNLKNYDKIWTERIIQADKDFAHYNTMSNVIPQNDPLLGAFIVGGVRVRKFPLIGTDSSTYAPSVNAVSDLVSETTNISGGKKSNKTAKFISDFGTGFKKGFVAPFQLVGDAATAMSPVLPFAALAMGAGRGNELEKAKESLKKFMNNERKTKPTKKHLEILEANGIISKKSEEKGEDVKGGNVNRLNKARKWTDFTVDTLNSGLGLASKAKTIAGSGKSKSTSWIEHVKDFSKKNNVSYKQALSMAKATYKKGGSYSQSF